MIWGGIPQGTGLFYIGKMYMPKALCQEPEHLLPPLQKQNWRGRSEQRHTFLHHQLPPEYQQGITKESTWFVVPMNLGIVLVSTSLSVMQKDALSRWLAVSPQEVLWHKLCSRLCPTSMAILSTHTGPGTSSHTLGWSGSGAGHRQL